jgi:hypothetical protein
MDRSVPQPHDRFYVPDDLTTIQVEDRLFRVSRSHLCKHSSIFADMFTFPHDNFDVEGRRDETPVHLAGVPIVEFEGFLDLLYATEYKHDLSAELYTDQTWLTLVSAIIRWDVLGLVPALLKPLGRCGDPVLQLRIARQLEIEHWVWPAMFSIILGLRSPNGIDIRDLRSLPADDSATIHSLAGLFHDQTQATHSRIYKETTLRQIIADNSQMREPSWSEIPPPRSGYRVHMHGPLGSPTDVPGPTFTEPDGSPIWMASCAYGTCYIPCYTVPDSEQVLVLYGRDLYLIEGSYAVLPIDVQRMEWVKSAKGIVPEGYSPVLGGWDDDKGTLYHAYGEKNGLKVPCMTNESLGAAESAWLGRLCRFEENYHVLVWKNLS